MFQLEDFERARDDALNPSIQDGWEIFTESHGITIYRSYNEVSGLYQYKVYGVLDGCAPETCVNVYMMDLDYRKKWDSFVQELREIKQDGKSGLYWQVKFPFFMSNRDYTFVKEAKKLTHGGKEMLIVLARSEPFLCEVERKGVIRISDYFQNGVLWESSAGNTRVYMHYYDNPKGSIPTWLINWAAKTGVPKFMMDLKKACLSYQDYVKQKENHS